MKYFTLSLLTAFTVLGGCKKEPAPDITTGLVINIALDGNAYESVTATTGMAHNTTAAVNRHGETGKAMQFNRADSAYLDFGDLANASFTDNNRFTICCWVNVTDTTAPAMAVLSKRSPMGPYEYSLDTYFDHGRFDLDNWTGGGGSSVYGTDPLKAGAPVSPGTWQHLAFVADGQTLKCYLNGVLQSGEDVHTNGEDFTNTGAPLVIGNGGGYGKSYYFDGKIDDIRMYNYPLPAATIAYLGDL